MKNTRATRKNKINIKLVPHSFSGYKGLEMHRYLLEDSVRTEAFRKAILKVIKKGDVVVDLGAGSGILSFFAFQAGAGKIYAIEERDIINVAKKIAQKNRMDHKIVFINEDSMTAILPEQIDVIISECIGYYVFGGDMISAVVHLRDRFLKKEGTVIPSDISMFIAPVQTSLHHEYINYWNRNIPYGIDLSPVQKMANNNIYLTTMDAENLISNPKKIATIDFSKDIPNEMLYVKTDFLIKEPCSIHGLCGWFDINLCKGVSLSTSPFNKTTIWQQVFFPIEEEILLDRGSVIAVSLVLKRSEEVCSCFDWTIEAHYPKGNKRRMIRKQSTKKSFPMDYEKICSNRNCSVDINGKKRNSKLEERARYIKEEIARNNINELKKKERINPDNPSTNFLLSKCYRKIGKIRQANKELDKWFSKFKSLNIYRSKR